MSFGLISTNLKCWISLKTRVRTIILMALLIKINFNEKIFASLLVRNVDT
jgi:hypothetical protein